MWAWRWLVDVSAAHFFKGNLCHNSVAMKRPAIKRPASKKVLKKPAARTVVGELGRDVCGVFMGDCNVC